MKNVKFDVSFYTFLTCFLIKLLGCVELLLLCLIF